MNLVPYLEITKAGGRYWRMKYRFAGKVKRLAFGVYPDISLKMARGSANKARKLLQDNQDPGEVRKEQKARVIHENRNTLEAVARDWIEHQSARWEPVTMGRIHRPHSKTTSSPPWDRAPWPASRPAM